MPLPGQTPSPPAAHGHRASPRGCCCHCATLGDIWGHPTGASSSPAAPFHSTERAERRGIIPNKTGMRKSAECWAVSRQPLQPPPRAPETTDHERKTSLCRPTLHQPTEQPPGGRNRHSLLHQGLHTALPRSHLQGEVSYCQSELGGKESTRISWGVGMCPAHRAGRQLCNPPPTSCQM